ncbi:MAG: SpoIIE family protein phosphatase [Bernardetiaceae bacterium]|nr:SpoIIE family protein phosphatase [Bernardetiaceae bacterium]
MCTGFICRLWVAVAESQDLRFKRFSIEDGLSQNNITCILEDSYGFLWMGTQDGLNYFDGYEFKTYNHTPGDTLSLSATHITALYEDHNQNVWVGTLSGISRFDRETDAFRQYTTKHNPNNINSNQVLCIYEDQAQHIWIGTSDGLSLYNSKLDKFEAVGHIYPGTSGVQIEAIFEDSRGKLWIGAETGLYYLDLTTKRLHSFKVGDNFPINSAVKDIEEDAKSNLWIATHTGLYQYETKSDVLHHYAGFAEHEDSLTSAIVQAISISQEQHIWIATYGGVYTYFPEKKLFAKYKHQTNNPYSLADNTVEDILVDRAQIIWVATLEGLHKFDPRKELFSSYQSMYAALSRKVNDNVQAILEDNRKFIWVAAGQDMYRYDPRTQELQSISELSQKVPPELQASSIQALWQAQDSSLWIGTESGGVMRYDFKADVFEVYKSTTNKNEIIDDKHISNNNVYAIYQDRYGTIWIGTSDGLDSYDPRTNLFKHYKADGKNGSLSDNTIWCIGEDRYGELWFGTSSGLNRYNPKKDHFKNYFKTSKQNNGLSDNVIISLYEDTKGNFWIGTMGGGLHRFDKENDKFEQFTEKDGLPDGIIYAISEDASGNLWLSTNRGISKFVIQERKFRNYDINDGLRSNRFTHGAVCRTTSGELIFGNFKGLNAFHPDSIKDNPFIPPVYITGLRVLNKLIIPDESNIIDKQIMKVRELTLLHEQNTFSFDFVALSYRLPQRNQYAYMLEGFDKDWIVTNYKNRTASYTNIPPGEYTFRLKASNNDGVWNEEGVAIKIIITPPFWQRIWFIALIAILIVAVIWGGYALRSRQLERQKIKLKKEVAMRTQELEAEKEKLQKANLEVSLKRNEILAINSELQQKQEEILAQRDDISAQRNEIEQAYEKVKILSTIGQQITATLDLEKLINRVYKQVNSLMDASGFGIGVYNSEKEIIEFRGFIENGEVLPYHCDPMNDDSVLSTWCLRNNQEILMNDIEKEYEKYIEYMPPITEGEMPLSLIYMPLSMNSQPLGVLTVQSFARHAYSHKQKTILEGLASYIAIALDNIRNYEFLKEAKKTIENSNLRIMDSIRYAKTIQDAILPNEDSFRAVFTDFFTIFRPKDVVSGDFYWLREFKDYVFIAVADCTGHGVPGAFMSMIGSRMLNEIVNEAAITEPAMILAELHRRIRLALKQAQSRNDDGMDIALCRIDKKTDTDHINVIFAGAKRPLVYQKGEKIKVLRGDIRSIGGRQKEEERTFTQKTIQMPPKTTIYMMTDGIADQNNATMKKYGTQDLYLFIEAHAKLPLKEQAKLLSKEIDAYQGSQKQRDDMTIIAITI